MATLALLTVLSQMYYPGHPPEKDNVPSRADGPVIGWGLRPKITHPTRFLNICKKTRT